MGQIPLVLDGLVLIALFACAIQGYRKGFVIEALSFLPMLGAFVAVKLFTPVVGRLLRMTPIFGSLSSSISNSMQLDETISSAAMQTQTEFIQSMALPDFLKNSLLENNNPVIYDLIGAEGLGEYIAGFLANVCVNILSLILVFVVAFIAIKFLLNALNFVSKLPILNFFNRFSGMVVGATKGLFWFWMIAMGLAFIQCSTKLDGVFFVLEQSVVTLFLYENNILLYLILTIFT
ncbi:MAG: CvpA family protein [Anaerotignum sp.]